MLCTFTCAATPATPKRRNPIIINFFQYVRMDEELRLFFLLSERYIYIPMCTVLGKVPRMRKFLFSERTLGI